MRKSAHTPSKRRRRRPGRSVLVPALVLAVVVFAVDRCSKFVVEHTMALDSSRELIPGVLSLTFIYNGGGAFGLLGGSRALLLAGSAVAVTVVLWMLLSGPAAKVTTAGCGLILGGAAGNLFDRLTTGRVTDYIHFSFWYIFNAADAAIVTGVLLLIVSVLIPRKVR